MSRIIVGHTILGATRHVEVVVTGDETGGAAVIEVFNFDIAVPLAKAKSEITAALAGKYPSAGAVQPGIGTEL